MHIDCLFATSVPWHLKCAKSIFGRGCAMNIACEAYNAAPDPLVSIGYNLPISHPAWCLWCLVLTPTPAKYRRFNHNLGSRATENALKSKAMPLGWAGWPTRFTTASHARQMFKEDAINFPNWSQVETYIKYNISVQQVRKLRYLPFKDSCH